MSSLTSEYLQKIRTIEASCSDCGAKNTIFTDEVNGTRVCKACGTIHEANMIDETSEWRNFGSESSGGADMNRVGGPVNTYLDNGGISATITGNSDAKLINSNNRIS